MIKKIIFLVFATVFFVGCKQQSAADTTVKIGAIFELTGNVPLVGISAKNAAMMAVKEVNDEGGIAFQGKKIPVTLIIKDSGASVNGAVTAVNKLIKQDKVLAIIGPNTSSTAMPAGNIAEKEQTLLITPWSTFADTTIDPVTGKHKKYVFRIGFNDALEVKALVNFARYTKNYKTAAILYESTSPTSVSQANFFKQDFEKLGGKVKVFESYKDTDKDFSSQLKNIKTANPDVLFLPNYYSGIIFIAKQAKLLGIQSEILASDNWNRPRLISMATGALEGAYFASHYSPDARSSLTQTFVKAYQDLYHQTPDDVAALTYDACQLLFKAISAAKKLDSTAVRNSLVDLPLLEGVTGTINFEERFGGDPDKSVVIVQVKNGQFVWVSYANP